MRICRIFLLAAGIFVLVSPVAWARSDDLASELDALVVRVVSFAGKGIPYATVGLIPVGLHGKESYCEIISLDSDGTFLLVLDWEKIEEANRSGVTWQISVEREGYLPGRCNVDISNGEIEPEQIEMLLKPDRCVEWFSTVDFFADPEALFLFDLECDKDNMGSAKLNDCLRDLKFWLDKGIGNYLMSRRLLGKKKMMFRVKRCPEVPVPYEEDAVVYGQRLDAPGIIWGYIEKLTSQFLSKTEFAIIPQGNIISRPVFWRGVFYYDRTNDNQLELGKPVDNAYLAFSSFALGNLYLRIGDLELARECLIHAKELDALPEEAKMELGRILEVLNEINPSKDLKSIGEE